MEFQIFISSVSTQWLIRQTFETFTQHKNIWPKEFVVFTCSQFSRSWNQMKVMKSHGILCPCLCVNPVSWQSGPNQRVMTGAALLMHSARFHGPSGVCGFEDSLCGLEHSRQETFHWTRSAGTTPTGNTGPSYDHTTFTEEGGPHWMWFCLQRYAAACGSQVLWTNRARFAVFYTPIDNENYDAWTLYSEPARWSVAEQLHSVTGWHLCNL